MKFTSDGGNSTFDVNTIYDCEWTTSVSCNWVNINAGNSGSGSGTVSYSVEANTSDSERTCTLTVEGKTFTIVQSAYIPPLSSEADIVSFELPGQAAPTEIGDSTIVITMPYNTDKTALIPTIEISENASISPLSGIATDFTEPVEYLLTAEDEITTKTWTVSVYNLPMINSSDSLIVNELSGLFEELNLPDDSLAKYISIIEDHIVSLNLSGLNLDGNFPQIVSQLNSLRYLDLSNNNLSGLLPDIFAIIDEGLKDALLENKLVLDYLNISNNRFVFSDLEAVWENLLHIPEFIYAPQAIVGTAIDTTIEKGENYTMLIEGYIPGKFDQYQWYKDATPISGAISETFTLDVTEYTDEGNYNCRITNSLITELILETKTISLSFSTPVGIENLELYELKIYPNPARDKVFIETGKDNPVLLKIVDIDGKQMRQIKEFTTGEIDISGFAKGIYIIRISDQNFLTTKQLIVQ
ncbi:T9SS type A sorting domain-containing protein [Draconibacterium halophilum]|nr:T9SS type A sorting domain-containing protein [Draconibacterium halophilum]